MDNFENDFPVLKNKTNEVDDFPILKKKGQSTPSGFSVTPLPSQDKFKLGQEVATIGYKSPLGKAIEKDKKVEGNWFAGWYNTLVGSLSSLAGGEAYISQIVGTPTIPMPLNVRVAMAQDARRKTVEFFEQARSSASSKEYEQQRGEFDIMPKDGGGIFSGIDLEDVLGVAFQAPKLLLDMAGGAATGGYSFFSQSINDNAKELEEKGGGDKMTDLQKVGYLFTQATAQAALEKYSIDKILKNTGLTKKVQQKLTAEVVEEFTKKGIKATAKEVEDALVLKASKLATRIKTTGLAAAKSALIEGVTEGTQQATSDAVKVITNKIAKNDVFDEEDINKNFWKNIVNSAVMGGVMGGAVGGGLQMLNNTNKAIRKDIASGDLQGVQQKISQQVEEGNLTPEEAEAANITAQQYAEIAGKIPTTVSEQDKYKIIGGIEQRENLKRDKDALMAEMGQLDPIFRAEKQDQLDLIQAKIDETDDYLEGIVTGKTPRYIKREGRKGEETTYYKVDEKGNKMPISKIRYELAKEIKKEDSRKKEPVDENRRRRVEQFDILYSVKSNNPEFDFPNTFEEFNKKIDSDPNYLPDLYKRAQKYKETGEITEDEMGTEASFIEAIEPIVEKDITIGEVVDKKGTYKGQKGTFLQEGDNIVFKNEMSGEKYQVGKAAEIQESPASEFDIKYDESLVAIDDKGNISVREKPYINRYSNPLKAINKDEDGNVVSVNLETEDGKKRTFKGSIAEDIAYQINLKEKGKEAPKVEPKAEQVVEKPVQVVKPVKPVVEVKEEIKKEVKPTEVEEIPSDLEEKGELIESTLEAERRRSNGERIFAITEQDEAPVEVTSIEMLRNYTPDQLLAYKPKIAEAKATEVKAEVEVKEAPKFEKIKSKLDAFKEKYAPKQKEKKQPKIEDNGKPIIVKDPAENDIAIAKLSSKDEPIEEPSIKAIEGKAESTIKAKLDEVVLEVDDKIKLATRVEMVPMSDLKTDEGSFQNREGLNLKKVDDIVENYNPSEFDPIIYWTDADGQKFTLNHHRFAAAQKLKLDEIPATKLTYPAGHPKEFQVVPATDKAEAIDFAINRSNANRSMETAVERAKALRKLQKTGTKEEINKFLEREGKNKTKVQNIAALNENGKTIEALKMFGDAEDVQLQKETEQRGDWIGEARRRITGLTDEHENEMFDFLMDKDASKRITSKADFISKVTSLAGGFDFNPENPLNLKRFKYVTEGERAYDEKTSQLKSEIDTRQSKIDELKARFSDPSRKDYIPTDSKDYEQTKKIADEQVSKLNTEIKSFQQKLQDHYKEKGKYQGGIEQGGLFATAEATTEEIDDMADIVKDFYDDGVVKLEDIKREITKALGYNTKAIRDAIEKAHTKMVMEYTPVEATKGVIGRVGNMLKNLFGKEGEVKVLKDNQSMLASAEQIEQGGGVIDYRFQYGKEKIDSLIAPNGKKSNLTKDQYILVRTQKFKNWFGDWESNPENASKILDENGEPRIVHHGTNVKFDKFDKSKLGSKNWMADSAYTGFFFAGDKKTSQAYVGINNADLMGLSLAQSPILTNITEKYKAELDAANKAIQKVSQNELEKDRKKYEDFLAPIVANIKEKGELPENVISDIYNNRKVDISVFQRINSINEQNGNNERLKKVNNKMFDEIQSAWMKEKGLEPIILNLFLNVRNPLIIDFNNTEREDSLTRNIELAKLTSNDGVVFKNLADGADIDDIFVAFESNQIKSATENVGEFSTTDDRFNYMAKPSGDILGFTYGEKIYLNGEKLNPNTPIHEAGHIWTKWVKNNNIKIYEKGMELVKGSKYLERAKSSKFYQEQASKLPKSEREAYFQEEALAMAIGDKGAQFVSESKKNTFKEWLDALWTKIKSLTGFKDLTAEEFQNLTFDQFSKMAVKEILGTEGAVDKLNAIKSFRNKKKFIKDNLKYESNKNAIDELDFTEEDFIEIAKSNFDLSTFKNIKDAVQKRSAEKNVQREQRKDGEARSRRGRMEQRVEGVEIAKEGETAQPKSAEKKQVDWEGAITIAANAERRNVLGLIDYESEAQSFEDWKFEAEKLLKRGYDVEALLDRLEKENQYPTPVENAIRKIYVASLDRLLQKDPSNQDVQQKLARYARLNDLINTRLGRTFVSLKGSADPRETLSDFFVAKMKANSVDKLTEKQEKEVLQQYKDIQEQKDKVNDKFEKNEELNTELIARDVVVKEKKVRKPYQKTRDYKAERKSVIESIKEKWNKAGKSDIATAVPVPYSAQLVAIAPDVSKLMRLYIEEGVDDLAVITSKIYNDLKDEIEGLQPKDIQDVIAGRYKKERPVLSEAQLKQKELRKEAELIAKIEDVLAGVPKTEKAKIEQNQKLAQLRNKLRDIKKEVGYDDLSKLDALKTRIANQIEDLDNKIKNNEFEKQVTPVSFMENPEFRKKYPKQYDEYLNDVSKLRDKSHEFEVALAKDHSAKMNIGQKIFKKFVPKLANTLKALLSTVDDSFIFVQLLPAIAANPALGYRAFKNQWKDFFNEARFKRQIVSIEEDKELSYMVKKSGLDILDPQQLRDQIRDEQVGGANFLEEQIKIGKLKIVPSKYINAPFERLASSAGNYIRLNMFIRKAAELESEGKTIDNSLEEYKNVARVINEMTGRGKLHKNVEKASGIINPLVWSPKMLASTLNLLGIGDLGNFILGGNKGFYRSLDPKSQAWARENMVKAIGMMVLVMAAFALDDEHEVDYDPNSVTFGQIKNTKTGDAWGIGSRFTSVIRYVLMMGMGVKHIKDEVAPVDYKKESFKFFRGKASPATGLATDAILRTKFNGEPFDLRDLPYEALVPLAPRDIYDALKTDGTIGLLTKGIPAFMGIKVMTEKMYNEAKQPLEDILRKHVRTEAKTFKIELKNPLTKEIATDKEYDEYVKKRDELITEKITKAYNNGVPVKDKPELVPFVLLNEKEASDEISRLKEKATNEAKEYVFGKKKKTLKERLSDRRLRILRKRNS